MAPKKVKGTAAAPVPAAEAPEGAQPAVDDQPTREPAGNEPEDATQVETVAPALEAEKEQEATTEQPPQELKPWKNPVSAVSDRLKNAGIANPWEVEGCNPMDFQLVFGALKDIGEQLTPDHMEVKKAVLDISGLVITKKLIWHAGKRGNTLQDDGIPLGKAKVGELGAGDKIFHKVTKDGRTRICVMTINHMVTLLIDGVVRGRYAVAYNAIIGRSVLIVRIRVEPNMLSVHTHVNNMCARFTLAGHTKRGVDDAGQLQGSGGECVHARQKVLQTGHVHRVRL